MENGRETYGIGEWYGRLLTSMAPEERRHYAEVKEVECPFCGVPCNKKGGVCSLRRYAETANGTRPARGWETRVCATCPSRFGQDDFIYRWIGRTLAEIPPEIDQLRESGSATIPFPVGRRHPDFRSSGPKRLMPQLQIKVPTLRRWGKKMAVVVDDSFFEAMGAMERAEHISNGDIIWFVVGYEAAGAGLRLAERDVYVTTLESSVLGLTAGQPVSQEEFEAAILEKVNGGAA